MITVNNFIIYSLNRYRNFIHQTKCIKLLDEDDVKEYCTNLLHEHSCPESAMFCVFNDGVMLAVIKIWDDGEHGQYEYLAAKDMHFFSQIDAQLRLCCYGLMCEIRPGEWKIQN